MRAQMLPRILFRIGAPVALATAVLTAQTQTPASASASRSQSTPVFRATVNYHSLYIHARDNKGQFVPDLKQSDFQVL